MNAKRTLLAAALCLVYQISFSQDDPSVVGYNPDSNADTLIDAIDLLSIISLYGTEFLAVDDDLDDENEIQYLTLSNDTLFLLPGASFVTMEQLNLWGSGTQSTGQDTSAFHIIDEDLNGVGDEMDYFTCVNKCNRLQVGDLVSFHTPSIDEISLDGDILFSEMWPDLDQSVYYWTTDRSATNSAMVQRFLLTSQDLPGVLPSGMTTSDTRCICLSNE